MNTEASAKGMVVAAIRALRRAAEKQDEHDAHQADPFEHRVRYLMDRPLDQVVPVDVGDDAHAHGRELTRELVDLGMNAFQDLRRILVLEHVDDAFDGVGIIVFAQDALPLLMGVGEPAEVADEDRHAFALGDDDIAEVRKGAHEADAADDVALFAAGNAAAAGVRAVVVDRRGHVVKTEPRRWSCTGSSSS